MRLAYDGQAVPLLVESDAFEGVKRIAGKLAEDICKVTGCKPQILPEGQLSAEQAGAVLCATMGKSPLLEALEQAGLLDLSQVRGKPGLHSPQISTCSWATAWTRYFCLAFVGNRPLMLQSYRPRCGPW